MKQEIKTSVDELIELLISEEKINIEKEFSHSIQKLTEIIKKKYKTIKKKKFMIIDDASQNESIPLEYNLNFNNEVSFIENFNNDRDLSLDELIEKKELLTYENSKKNKDNEISEENDEEKKKLENRNYKNINSENYNFRFASSFQYTAVYKGLPKFRIQQHFSKLYNGENIDKIIERDDEIEVKFLFKKQMRLRIKHCDLIIENKYTPYSLENFPKNKNEKKMNPINDIVKKNINNEFTWLYEKNFYFEKEYFSTNTYNNEYTKVRKNIDNDIYKMLFIPEKFDGNKFCSNLKNYFSNLDVLFFNESILASTIFNFLAEFIDRNRILHEEGLITDIVIISLDHKFEEIIDSKVSHFKCDIVFYCEMKLYIGEFKFSNDKTNQSLNGINCITFKQYSERTINFLKKKSTFVENVEQNIKEIIEFSIAIEKRDLDVSMHVRGIKKEDLNLNKYLTSDFVENVKNKKNFINILKKK